MPVVKSIRELLFDRQECFNDAILCLNATVQGIPGYTDRLKRNLSFITTINNTCKKRGFDPARFNQVEDALKKEMTV